MAVKDIEYTSSILHPDGMELPSNTPPKNHGHTPAAWFLTILGILGALIAGVSLTMNSMVGIVIGVIVMVVGVVGGVVLALAGKGQPHSARRQQ